MTNTYENIFVSCCLCTRFNKILNDQLITVVTSVWFRIGEWNHYNISLLSQIASGHIQQTSSPQSNTEIICRAPHFPYIF